MFVPLHVHSEYSLSDGILRVGDIVAHAKAEGLDSIALTDKNNTYGLLKFYKKAVAAGIKPILGCDLTVRWANGDCAQLVLLAQNAEGLRHLNEIVSFAYQFDQEGGEVFVNAERLTQAQCTHLIALSPSLEGDCAKALKQRDWDLARKRAMHWQEVFQGRFYFLIERLGREGEAEYERFAQALGADLHIASLAGNLACFKMAEDFEVHEVRVCIASSRVLSDESRPKLFTRAHYLRTQKEMEALFADAPLLLENSVAVSKMCNVHLELGKNYLPDFPLPEGVGIERFLVESAEKGLELRLEALFPDEILREEKRGLYFERLHKELQVINQMGFPGYFLIVADFIRWARENDVPVGPGRGSGAGSLVAFALQITDLDPLAYDLLFERFLNPERVSMPDFDIDFCMDKRDLVIRYVCEKYGYDKVSQIATHGTMAAKAVVRDVGRVLGLPYGACDAIAKKIPKALGVTLSDALGNTTRSQEKPEFFSLEFKEEYEHNDEARELIDIALKLEGLARNVGKHAGGVVISPTKLTDFSSIYCESAGAGLVSQFDKDDIEAVGLVKFDFLGLRTLTVIDWALKSINKRRERENKPLLRMADVPLDDKKTFALLKSARTSAVFQLESSGMKNLIKKLKPDNFEDIIALVALFRPGPLQSGMVDDFINRKHGLAKVSYPHPDLEGILENTYGVMVYQEQVMQVAQTLAHYSLGEADLLRRAMGKKKAEVMVEQKMIFVERAVKSGVIEQTAVEIFDLMAKFAEYGFNKSHSAAYGLLSYHTAWLKAHYPAELMAAVLSSDMDKIDKMVLMVDEALDMGLEILPPSINYSQFSFSVDEKGRILFGLGAIKGVGEQAVLELIAEREKNGKYLSLLDLCKRVDLKAINKNTLEMLISAGAFDDIEPNRGALFHVMPQAIRLASKHHEIQNSAQQDMFGMFAQDDHKQESTLLTFDYSKVWSDKEKLEREKTALAMYLTDHPINAVRRQLQALCSNNLAFYLQEMEIMTPPNKRHYNKTRAFIGGLVSDVRRIPSKKTGNMLLFFTLDDRSARYEFLVPPKVYDEFSQVIALDKVVLLEAEIEFMRFRNEWGFNLLSVRDLAEAQFENLRALRVEADVTLVDDAFLEALKSWKEMQEDVAVGLEFVLHNADDALSGSVRLGGRYAMNAEHLSYLERHFGRDKISFFYRNRSVD